MQASPLIESIGASSAPNKFMRKLLQLGLVWALLAVTCVGQRGALTVLPWDNHRAAVSLTFDDADSVQLDKAVPELNKRQLRATFFLTISKLTRLDDWRKVQREGHEIGNHSVSHEHPSGLTKADEELQVEDAKKFLDSNFRSDVCIFAYPYEETSPGLAFWVKKYDFAARGWRGSGDHLYVRPDADPDWYSLPSQPTYSRYDSVVYQGWIDKAISTGTWTTLQMHGMEDASTGWEPISIGTFAFIVNYLKAAEQRGLWVAPFGIVAAYLRAQRTLQQAESHQVEGGEQLNWTLPQPFPPGVVLKARVRPGSRFRVFQRGHELHPDKHGVYSVSFDARELTVRGGL
jgi:peptidoglycan/xylan/chitin deacetylase (PgdA/CDA1 family)